MPDQKPIHAKPSLYAHMFFELKEIALKYGYNLVLHGSMSRDLDLIAIPWAREILPYEPMIEEFAKALGGYIMEELPQYREAFANTFHGRRNYVINLNRECREINGVWTDPLYYVDISITPAI